MGVKEELEKGGGAICIACKQAAQAVCMEWEHHIYVCSIYLER